MDILRPTHIEFAIGNMISDQYLVILRECISLTPIHLNKISCSDRPTVVHSRTLPYVILDWIDININEQRSVNCLQTNCVIYLPVVVKGAACVLSCASCLVRLVWRDLRRGLPANTTQSPNAPPMLCQRRRRWPTTVATTHCPMLFKCWASVVDSVVALTQHYVSVSCSLCALSQSSQGLLTKHADWPTYRYVLQTLNLLLERWFFLLNSTSMYNAWCLFVTWIGKKKHRIIHGDIR